MEQAGWQLLERLGARCLLVTRGAKGLALFEKSGDSTFVPIFGSDEIADVTGAGDTVISTFTLALASGARPIEAARLSNYAGGLVVMKRAPPLCPSTSWPRPCAGMRDPGPMTGRVLDLDGARAWSRRPAWRPPRGARQRLLRSLHVGHARYSRTLALGDS